MGIMCVLNIAMKQCTTPAPSYQGRCRAQIHWSRQCFPSPNVPSEMRKAHWRKLTSIREFIHWFSKMKNVLMGKLCFSISFLFCLLILASETGVIYTENNLDAPPEAHMVYIGGHFVPLVLCNHQFSAHRAGPFWSSHTLKTWTCFFFPSIKLLPLKSSCLNIFPELI